MSRWQQETSGSEAAGDFVGNAIEAGAAFGLFAVRPRAVEVVHIYGDTADLLVDGEPVAVDLPGGEAAQRFAEDTTRLVPLRVDANFYGSLPDVHTRIEYLSGHDVPNSRGGRGRKDSRGGRRESQLTGLVCGRVLWHDLPGNNAVITVAVADGFSLYPVRAEYASAA